MKKIIGLLLFLVSTNAYAFDLASVIEWKYGSCAGTEQQNQRDATENPKMVISYWKCAAPQPSEKQLVIDSQEYQQFLDSEAIKDVREEADLKTKLKISDEDLDVLAKLIRERS